MEPTPEQVAGLDDVDALWRALTAAKAAGDHALVRVVESRMRELTEERRFAHLDDGELLRRIRSLQALRHEGTADMIPHSPPGGSGGGGNDDAPHIQNLNAAIRRNQSADIRVTLAALLDERERRGLA